MAEKKAPEKQIAVLAPDPETGKLRFATANASSAEAIKRAGGKVLTAQEAAAEQLHEEYAQKSTAEKVIGGATALATGPIVGNALAGSGTIAVTPEVQALQQGESAAITGGLDQVAVHHALESVAGKEAAKAYAKNQRDVAQAHEGFKTAGELAGFGVAAYGGGGLGGAARAIPGVGISALGAGAESLAARGLAGVASRGVLGRALATSGELAARGAVEGALYGAANEITEADLGDRDLAADKLFSAMGHGALFGGLGGAALGGTGSLAKSAVGGAYSAARGGLARVMSRGQQAAADMGAKAEVAAEEARALARGAADDARATAENAVAQGERAARQAADDVIGGARKTAGDVAEMTGTNVPAERSAGRSLINDLQSVEGQRGLAYDQAWNAIGRGFGLQTTGFAGKAARYLPNGTRDVGEVLMRKGVINAQGTLLDAARAGTPAEMLPRITAAKEAVGERIGVLTDASPARVSVEAIADAVDAIAAPYQGKAGQRHIAASVRDYGDELAEVLGILKVNEKTGTISYGLPRGPSESFYGSGDVSVQALLKQRKALDELVFQEVKALDPKMRVQALRDLRSRLEGSVVDALDEAGGKLPGETAAEYKALKKDFFALSIAEDAATDSAARMAKNHTFSLTDRLAGNSASGVVGSVATAVAHKALRERGNAAAAVLIHRMADMGTITKMVRTVDDQIGKAARGLLREPPANAPFEKPVGSVRDRAEAALRRVSEAKADPEAFMNRVSRETEALSVNAPELAGALSQRMTDAMSFLSSKVPSPPPPDPLDPHPTPMLTDAEASRLAKYAWYTERPARFFEEVEHGHLTFEGIETARALMPAAFAELQARTAEGLAQLAAQGRKPPFAERQKLGTLLDFPATISQGFAHAQFLQKNAVLASQAAPGSAPAPKRSSSSIPTQRSPLDRLEASGPGRR